MRRKGPAHTPAHDELPPDLPEEQRRAARMRLVAGRRLAGLTVVLDGVHDPHNISAVLRSAEGFGLLSANIIGAPQELSPNRAITKGCEKWLNLRYYCSASECADALHAQGFELLAAVPDRAAQRLEEVDFSRKLALVFGHERNGITPELLALCDGRFQIRMTGFSQSLNVSVAAGISMYIGACARRRHFGDTDLAPEQEEALVRKWTEE